MADEPNDPILAEGLDFAQMITGDEADNTTPPPEEVKPEPEEDENPFKTDDPKPEDTKPDKPDAEVEPEKPSTNAHWEAIRSSRERYKAESEEKETLLREKDAQVAELKAKAARTTELEERLRVFDEQERELALARVESTREYKDNIQAPLDLIGEQAEILASSNDGDITEVKKMLVEADPAKQRALLKDVTAGWDEIDRIDLKKMAEDARNLLDKQDAMRANAHAAAKERDQMAAQKDAEMKETQKKEFVKATGDVVKSLREKLPFVPLTEGENEDDRYSVLEQKVAQVDLAAQTPRAQALAVASALALPQAIKTIGLKDAEIASLKEALAKATGGKPSVTPKADALPQGDDEGDFFDNMGIPQPKQMFGPA